MGRGAREDGQIMLPAASLPEAGWSESLRSSVDLSFLLKTRRDALNLGVRAGWLPPLSRNLPELRTRWEAMRDARESARSADRAHDPFTNGEAEDAADDPVALLAALDARTPLDAPLLLSVYLKLTDLVSRAYWLAGEDAASVLALDVAALDFRMVNPRLSDAEPVLPYTLADARDAYARGLRFRGTSGEPLADGILATLADGETLVLFFDELRFRTHGLDHVAVGSPTRPSLRDLVFLPGASGARTHAAVTTLAVRTAASPASPPTVFDEHAYAMRMPEALVAGYSHPADTICRADCASCSLVCMKTFSKHTACTRWASISDLAEAQGAVRAAEAQVADGEAKGPAALERARRTLAKIQPCSQGNEGFECPCQTLFGQVQAEVTNAFRGTQASTKSSTGAAWTQLDASALYGGDPELRSAQARETRGLLRESDGTEA